MKHYIVIFSLLAALFVSGCETAQQKRTKVTAQTAYAIQDSLKAGRIDLARKYSDQLVRVNAPPKKRIDIKPIVVTAPVTTENPTGHMQITVLPEDLQGHQTMAIGTKEFNSLVQTHPDIAAQLKKDDQNVASTTKATDEALRATQAELESAKKKGLWGWILGLGSGLGILGVIAICVFFPAAIPLVINIFTGIIGGINSGISAIASKFKKPPTTPSS